MTSRLEFFINLAKEMGIPPNKILAFAKDSVELEQQTAKQ